MPCFTEDNCQNALPKAIRNNIGDAWMGEAVPLITAEELTAAWRKIKDQKAPRSDGVSSAKLKWPLKLDRTHFSRRTIGFSGKGYSSCHGRSTNWRYSRREKKKLSDQTAYSSICLLNAAGKIIERIVFDRLKFTLRLTMAW